MIEVTKYRNQLVGVYGLGKSNKAAIFSLIAGGAEVIAMDDNLDNIHNLQNSDEILNLTFSACNVQFLPLDNPKWHLIKALVLAPGIPLYAPEPHAVVKLATKLGVDIICDIELLYNTCLPANFIGITGTNGKSTTTDLTYHIFKHANKRSEMGGNIGTAALQLEPLAKDSSYIIELSSFQLDLLKETKVNVGILTNITEDHLDRYKDFQHYIESKKHIYKYFTSENTLVIGVDNEHTGKIYTELLKTAKFKIIPVSYEKLYPNGILVTDKEIIFEGKSFDISSRTSLKGEHNLQNIGCAFGACISSGIDAEIIAKAVCSYPGLKHRMELIAKSRNITFINDSKATNQEAAVNAIKALDNIYWLAGGVAKTENLDIIAPYYNKIKKAFLFGKDKLLFEKILKSHVEYSIHENLEEAYKAAFEEANKDNNDSTILLSPAAASTDQWPNFEARGEGFRKMVLASVENHVGA